MPFSELSQWHPCPYIKSTWSMTTVSWINTEASSLTKPITSTLDLNKIDILTTVSLASCTLSLLKCHELCCRLTWLTPEGCPDSSDMTADCKSSSLYIPIHWLTLWAMPHNGILSTKVWRRPVNHRLFMTIDRLTLQATSMMTHYHLCETLCSLINWSGYWYTAIRQTNYIHIRRQTLDPILQKELSSWNHFRSVGHLSALSLQPSWHWPIGPAIILIITSVSYKNSINIHHPETTFTPVI